MSYHGYYYAPKDQSEELRLQRAALLRQEQALEAAHDHNRTLLALLDQRNRQLAAVRAELMAVRGELGEEMR